MKTSLWNAFALARLSLIIGFHPSQGSPNHPGCPYSLLKFCFFLVQGRASPGAFSEQSLPAPTQNPLVFSGPRPPSLHSHSPSVALPPRTRLGNSRPPKVVACEVAPAGLLQRAPKASCAPPGFKAVSSQRPERPSIEKVDIFVCAGQSLVPRASAQTPRARISFCFPRVKCYPMLSCAQRRSACCEHSSLFKVALLSKLFRRRFPCRSAPNFDFPWHSISPREREASKKSQVGRRHPVKSSGGQKSKETCKKSFCLNDESEHRGWHQHPRQMSEKHA